jgi:hyperosmotically inducible protein
MNRFGPTATLLAALMLGAAGCASGGSQHVAGRADDATISSAVKAAVAQDKQLPATDIDVDTSNGIVRLSGFVSSAEDVAAAAAAARTVRGVQSVRNDLRLK